MLARKSDNFLNSTFSNVPSVQEMEEPGLLEISAADARARGIADGDKVRVFNHRGDILLKSASRWQSAAWSRFRETQLGEDDLRFPEHQCPDFRKTYRHGQLGNVLFRLG